MPTRVLRLLCLAALGTSLLAGCDDKKASADTAAADKPATSDGEVAPVDTAAGDDGDGAAAQGDGAEDPQPVSTDAGEPPFLDGGEGTPEADDGQADSPNADGDDDNDNDNAAPSADDGDSPTPADTKATPKTTTTKASDSDKPKADLKLGKEMYSKHCKSCHGADGKGNTKFAEKTPVGVLHRTKLSKAKIAQLVRDGVPDTKMKPLSGKMSAAEIDAVAAYSKTL